MTDNFLMAHGKTLAGIAALLFVVVALVGESSDPGVLSDVKAKAAQGPSATAASRTSFAAASRSSDSDWNDPQIAPYRRPPDLPQRNGGDRREKPAVSTVAAAKGWQDIADKPLAGPPTERHY